LPRLVEAISAIGARYRLRIANLMHAGDGNVHPIILYDDRDPECVARVIAAGDEILRACLALGGSLTGEHGIGVEKRELMREAFSADVLDAMRDLRAVFNPLGLCNPGKIIPTDRRCVEARTPGPRGGG
jgi:glycolate oxidase